MGPQGEPRDAGRLPDLPADDIGPEDCDPADRLVTRHDRQPASLQIALDQLEVGSAHGAGGDLEDELAGPGFWIGELDQRQG